MINWKVAIGSAVIAVILSLLTGIISGVSFGTLLLRAFMWGALFCGVGMGASYLVSRYLPELVSPGRAEEESDEESGTSVDIVLPDENPHIDGEDDDEDADPLGGPGTDFGQTSGGRKRLPGQDSAPTQADGLIEEVEEAQGERQQDGGSGSGGGDAWDDAGARDAELPDLGDEGSVDAAGDESGFRPGALADLSSVSRHGSTIDVLGHETDPEEIAQAIRTAMNKDQKG